MTENLLCDCEIFAKLRSTFVSSSLLVGGAEHLQRGPHHVGVRDAGADRHHPHPVHPPRLAVRVTQTPEHQYGKLLLESLLYGQDSQF